MTLYRTRNPATETITETFETATESEIETALQTSHEAFQGWRETGFDHRAQLMRQAATVLRERVDELAELMTKEMGKPIASARSEVEKCAWVCDHYASYAASYLAEEAVPTDATKSVVRYDPLGTVLAIMPWNFPLWQVFRFAAPNLMAGNVGILKHAPNVPQSAAAIEDVFEEAGFPEGVFQNLYATNDQAAAMIADDRVKAVTLTGSARAGSEVAATAGEHLKKTVLELGGSDPLIVLPDADIQQACKVGSRSRLLNSGQSCIAAKRFIVHEEIADTFMKGLQTQFDGMRLGNPMDEETTIGPLAREDLRDDLAEQVERSIEAGADRVQGGTVPDRDGYFYQPTILRDPPEGSPAYEEELFGPVATVFTVQDVDEAIDLANSTAYGLGASLWTDDIERAETLAPRIEAGNVFVNELVKSDPRLPFGGVKDSGYGRELGEDGIKEFVNRKTVYID